MWLILCFALVFGVTGLLFLVASDWIRSQVDRFTDLGLAQARVLGGYISRIANELFLHDRDRYHVNRDALVGWIAINLLAIFLTQLPIGEGAFPVVARAAQLTFGVLNLFLVGAFLLKAREEEERLNSVRQPSDSFPESPAISDTKLLFTSAVLITLHLASAVAYVDRHVGLFATKPSTSIAFVDYLIAVCSSLPLLGLLSSLALEMATWITQQSNDVVYLKGWGRFVQGSIFFVGSAFLIGALSIPYRQKKAIGQLIEALLQAASSEERDFAHAKIARAPGFVEARLVEAAVTPTRVGDQRHAIDAAIREKISFFVMRFCRELGRQDFEIKKYGLDESLKAIAGGAITLDSALTKSTLVPIARYARSRARSKEIRSKLYLLILLILQKAQSNGLSAIDIQSWESEPDLANVPNMIINAATKRVKLTYGQQEVGDKKFKLQSLAIQVGLDYGILALPTQLVLRLHEFSNTLQLDMPQQIGQFCDRHSDRFFTDNHPEELTAAIERAMAREGLSAEVRTRLNYLRGRIESRRQSTKKARELANQNAPREGLLGLLRRLLRRMRKPHRPPHNRMRRLTLEVDNSVRSRDAA